jgi:hypothetical protein
VTDTLLVLLLGFALGVRHAADADHVVAVTTIVTSQRGQRGAAVLGMCWGLGHTVTLLTVGAGLILLKLTIPSRLAAGLELAVAAILVVLGALNVSAFRRHRHREGAAATSPSPIAARPAYRLVRPFVVGIVHGLAGSAAVTLLVVATVGEPRLAIAYLLVFGLGTMAGMTLITMGLASVIGVVAARAAGTSGRLALACGVLSIVFGLTFAYQTWAAVVPP